jgi:transketolase
VDAPAHDLSRLALRLREDLIEMNWRAGTSHIGGALSLVEIMVVLYFDVLRVDPGAPTWPERDRLVVSKAHASATWYAALAERGFFPRQRLFDSFITVNGMLQEHADMTKTPGVDMSAGSLGHGLSAAAGMAWAARHFRRSPEITVYVILGDGECQEGQVWEAAMSAAHLRLDNLVAIVDCNDLQVNGPVCSVMGIEPLAAKWQAFNWRTQEVDGHAIPALIDALTAARDARQGCPQVIIARTVKGKGISFMENNAHWHGGSLSESQYIQAKQELAQLADSLVLWEDQPNA